MLTRRRPTARHAALPLAAAAPVALALLAGCHTGDSASTAEAKEAGALRCTAVSSAQVAVNPPVAEVKDGQLKVTGTVQRRPGAAGRLDGRVDVDLIGPDGLLLDRSLHCPLQPPSVPADSNQTSAYAPVAFGYVPPAGSTLRARYVDRQAAILEDLKEGDLNYNGNYGHTGTDVPPSMENGSMPANPAGGTGN